MSIILIGLIGSVLTSLIKWLNNKLRNTTLRGKGAQLLATVISLIGSTTYLYVNHMLDFSNWQVAVLTFTAIHGTADLYYKYIVEKFINPKV